MSGIEGHISFNEFTDMADFYGGGMANYELKLVKRREDFLQLFSGASHVDAVTYAESPDLLVEMLSDDGLGIGSLDVLIGNADDYQDNKVNDVPTAKELVNFSQDGRLTIQLKNRKTVHCKIYRIVMPDDTVKLVHGSANLSRNSWNYHTNQISIFTTDRGSELDTEFLDFIDQCRSQYSDETLLDGLVEAVEEAESEEDRDETIQYWVGTGELDISDTAALNQDATQDIEGAVEEVVGVVDDPGRADETVAFVDEPENVDNEMISDGPAGNDTDESVTDGGNSTVSEPDVGLVEAEHETGLTETIDRPRVKAGDETIQIGTTQVEKETADDFGASLSRRGATVDDHSITTPFEAYTAEVRESTDIPVLHVMPETEQVVIGDDDEMVLVASSPATPDVLNHCLETIEDYIRTVEHHGHTYSTRSETAVMAQMYEAFIYSFWAPFANQYARARSSPSKTLSNLLQHLYIVGESDAGKDKLVEYILRLISDNTVTSGVDADDVGVREVRGIREWDTAFPYALIDAEKEDIEGWSPIRNYWDDWTPASVDQPCMIFTTNDNLPKTEFRNRMKILSMDVRFPANPDDPGFDAAQNDLEEVLERQNPIFSYVAREMMNRKPWQNGTGTVADVRRIFNDFYEQAGREKPTFFPAKEPAERKYDTGRMKWQTDIRGGRITFEPEPEGITAHFDREGHEVYDYSKRLPKRAMGDKSGTSISIGAPEEFAEWLGYSVEELLDGVADDAGVGYESSSATTDDSDDSGLFSALFG